MNTIASLLCVEDILLDINVANKSDLFDAVGQHLEREHGLRPQWVAQALARREQVGSTGLGLGFAIPHARVLELDQVRIAYLRLKSPIAFAATDGKPVHELLVLLVPKQATEEHLRILADATEMFSDRPFRSRLEQCRTASEIKRQFDAWPLTASSGGDSGIRAQGDMTTRQEGRPFLRGGNLFSSCH